MPIFPRYVLRRFFPSFLACLAALILILFMNKFVRLTAVAALRGASPGWVLACFALLLPYFLSLTLPTAFLIGCMITLDRFSQDGELLAARLAGFSFLQLTWPLLALSLLLCAAMLGLDHWAAPGGLKRFHRRYESVSSGFARIEPGVLTRFGTGRIRVREVDGKTGWMRGVNLFLRRDEKWLIVTAPRATVAGEGVEAALDVRDGRLQLPNSEDLVEGRFERFLIPLHPTAPSARPGEDLREMPSGEVLSRRKAVDAASSPGKEYSTELSLRSAAASAPLAFYWLVVPVFFLLKPSQRGRAYASGLLVLLVFYGLFAAGAVMSRRAGGLAGTLYPWLATAAGLAAGAPLAWNCFF
jgi:lipopolysaccharide export LptBFGC system permease protein LptF